MDCAVSLWPGNIGGKMLNRMDPGPRVKVSSAGFLHTDIPGQNIVILARQIHAPLQARMIDVEAGYSFR